MERRLLTLRVKQRVLGPGADYEITQPESGEIAYVVKSVPTGVGHSFEMHNAEGATIATIHQHLLPVEPNYVIRRDGIIVGEIHRDLSAVTFPRFVLGGIDGLVLTGDQSDTKFSLLFRGEVAARVEKELSHVGTAYTMRISGDVDIVTALCMLVAVDDAIGQEAD